MVSATANDNSVNPVSGKDVAPVVVIGTGPAGIRTVQEMARIDPGQQVVIFGDEPWEPYNRVRLTQILAGHSSWADVFDSIKLPDMPGIVRRYNCPIVEIDREAGTVKDAAGAVQPYSKLVMATGSRPHVPNICGINLDGVFTFRNMSDVQGLLARRARSRHTLVIGGGLLGIEAARALQRSHTTVSIVEHGSRLMKRQLDDCGSEILREHVIQKGISVFLAEGVREILGERLVEGVRLRSGRILAVDTIVVSAGITPNTSLALQAGLSTGHGIRVNDRLQTSDANIYAVGECAEHRGRTYGLVAPGLEQASVAAHTILGRRAGYQGSFSVSGLKVLEKKIFSIGRVTEEDIGNVDRVITFGGPADDCYRKLVLHHGRLVGAVATGSWQETGRIQEAVTFQRRIWPWQQLRFRRSGEIWLPREAGDVRLWPASATVCHCTGVTRGELGVALTEGCRNVEQLAARTGASSVCGTCRHRVMQLLGETPVGGEATGAEAKGRTALLSTSVIVLPAVLAFGLMGPVAYPDTVQSGWHISALWTDGFFKQVSGFGLLGVSVIALLLSLRKRIGRFAAGAFSWWRIMHATAGVLMLVVLFIHTGLGTGRNLDFLLMASLLGLALSGSVSAGITACDSGGAGLMNGRWRHYATWTHILFFWPLPVLLGFHILGSYYF